MPPEQSQSTNKRPIAALFYDPENDPIFFSIENKAELHQLLSLQSGILTAEDILAGQAKDVEILITGWGASTLTANLLEAMPSLQQVLHVGGSVKGLVGSGEVFRKGIRVGSTNPELAQSVAEFCMGQIILAGKHVPENRRFVEKNKVYPPKRYSTDNYPWVVGLIGYGAIARRLRRLLKGLTIKVWVHDPYLSREEATEEGIKLVTLPELFQGSDIVSCHLSHTKATEGMLRGDHFNAMKRRATFLNTARGQVINEEELVAVLRRRNDLWAILDVVAHEPIAENHPFHDLPNVILTPHIAGATGAECRRLGRFATEEILRWTNGEALIGEVAEETLSIRA
ncbi:MAG: hydroxyacid dehydrogenase [Puniceicoccaceae bacterium]